MYYNKSFWKVWILISSSLYMNVLHLSTPVWHRWLSFLGMESESASIKVSWIWSQGCSTTESCQSSGVIQHRPRSQIVHLKSIKGKLEISLFSPDKQMIQIFLICSLFFWTNELYYQFSLSLEHRLSNIAVNPSLTCNGQITGNECCSVTINK